MTSPAFQPQVWEERKADQAEHTDVHGCLQALASERELLVALFGDDAADGSGAVEESMSPRSRPPDMPSTAALLDQVFESICRPLKVR